MDKAANKRFDSKKFTEAEMREMMRDSSDDFKTVKKVRRVIPPEELDKLKIEAGELAAKISGLQEKIALITAGPKAEIKQLKAELGPKVYAIRDGFQLLKDEEVYLFMDIEKGLTDIRHFSGETIETRRSTVNEKQLLFNHKITPIDGSNKQH